MNASPSTAGLRPTPILLLLIPALFAVWHARPLLPVDETRYTAVAWEMWRTGEFLVPHLNGETYAHKPPVLFWLMHAGWSVFGVNLWWPRVLGALALCLNALMIKRLGRRMWPQQPQRGGLAAMLFVSALFPFLFSTALMFDLWLVPWVVLGWTALVDSHRGAPLLRTSITFAAAVGFGILTKGPVTLLFLLPPVLAASHWSGRARSAMLAANGVAGRPIDYAADPTESPVATRASRSKFIYATGGLGILLGAVIALAWAIPAGFAGGQEYRDAIFWGQTAGRIKDSFAHSRPFWWFLPLLPGMLFPWLWWPRTYQSWRGLSSKAKDLGRLMFWCLAPAFLFLCLMDGKQPHYLLPLFAMAALALAWNLDSNAKFALRPSLLPFLLPMIIGFAMTSAPLWASAVENVAWLNPQVLSLSGIGLLILLRPAWSVLQHEHMRPIALAFLAPVTVTALHFGMGRSFYAEYDLEPTAEFVAQWQEEQTPVGYFGSAYYGQFHFLGRLEQPLANPETTDALRVWLEANPEGQMLVVVRRSDPPTFGPAPYPALPHGSRLLHVWESQALLERLDQLKLP
jgi:4-amino-4-deoxy-L-arabinose transferase-like glycosyltransferase